MNMKITKYILSLAAALGLFAGCQKPEMVQMSAPENVLAPVLADVADEVVVDAKTMTKDTLEFSWTKADYGVNTQINYSVEVAVAGSEEKAVVTSGITVAPDKEPVAKVTYETLNKVFLTSLKLAASTPTDVNFYVSSQVGQAAKVYSNAVAVNVTAAAAEIDYPKLTVVGNYQGWAAGKGQYVFDFAGDDKVYQGLIDFGANGFDHTTLEFKITGKDWGAANGEHSVPDGETPEKEAAKITLVNGGGGNITAYGKFRYYHFTFDKTAPSLAKNSSFDQVGVIGANGDWNNDIVMNFDPVKQKFWADVDFPSDSEFKFRLDAEWSTNWGVTDEKVVKDGGNIPVKAGKYRIYFNMNNFDELTYEINVADYGKTEETPSEPEQPEDPEQPAASGWGLIGVGGDWSNDIAMTIEGAFGVVKDVQLTANEGWKLRKDAAWAVNRGATGDADPTTVSTTEATAVKHDGKNMCVAADGKYDIYYNETEEVIWVLAAGSAKPAGQYWGLIGVAGDWNNDVTLVKDGDYFSVKNLALTAGGFKIRANREWNNAANYGLAAAGTIAIDTEVPVITDGGSANIGLPADGTYDVYFDLANEKVYVMTPGKTPAEAGEAEVKYTDASTILVGLSGKFGGTEYWSDPADNRKATFESKTLTDEAKYAGNYVYKIEGFQMSNGDEFKVRINGAWIDGKDTAIEGIDASGEGNVAVAEGGTFNIKISFDWDGLTHSNVKATFAK